MTTSAESHSQNCAERLFRGEGKLEQGMAAFVSVGVIKVIAASAAIYEHQNGII